MNKDLLKETYISFFFLGKAPIAPGTFGTFGGLILAFLTVIFFGEGILDPSAIYGTTKDLNKFIDSKRIIEMPLSENSLTGVAIGAAMMGKRPILSFHRVEFALLAIEQIFNNAAKANFLSGGSYSTPLLVRAIIGRGWGQGPSHSQGFESVFASVPGLKVVCPSVAETCLLYTSEAADE